MKRRVLLGSLFTLFVMIPAARALEGDPYGTETPAQRDARMAWWREAKFGMFIHWGVYAVPAGTFEGRQIGGIGEWIMLRGKIPVASYQAFASQFNPVKYDPAAWADLAKEAGMRYMVITSKHHDGFALFPSGASKWNVVDATPWKKDLIGPLAEAARSRGLKFGLYYSQAQDWTHPGGAKAGYKEGGGWDDAHKGDFEQYLDQVAVPQVREILTRYQPDVLWWDTPHLMNPGRAEKLVKLLALKPGIIHNNRLGGGYRGDTETPEQRIPATGFPGRDWETCMTMNDTWGYKSYDHHWKPLATIITNLVDIASKGGNYLLNVGPTAEGEIPAESVALLKQVGAWMKVNGESIYGTRPTLIGKPTWGRCTVKSSGEDTILYLHVFDWPGNGKLLVPGLQGSVKSVDLLAGGAKATAESADNGLVLVLPSHAPDPICSTIRLVMRGKPEISEPFVVADNDGVIRLLPKDARLEGNVRSEGDDASPNIGHWTNPTDSVAWSLSSGRDGKYAVNVETASPGGGSVLMVQGVGKLAFPVPDTGSFGKYQVTRVGEVSLCKGVKTTLTLLPVKDGWHAVNVRKVELIPQP